jgi:uncharacterized protein (DUF2344 family)
MISMIFIVLLVLAVGAAAAMRIIRMVEPAGKASSNVEEIRIHAESNRAEEDFRHGVAGLDWEVRANALRDDEEELQSRLKAAQKDLPSKDALPLHKKILIGEGVAWCANCVIDTASYFFVLEALFKEPVTRVFLAIILFIVFSSGIDYVLEYFRGDFHKQGKASLFKIIGSALVMSVVALLAAATLIAFVRGQIFVYDLPAVIGGIPQLQGLVDLVKQCIPAALILLALALTVLSGVLLYDIRLRSAVIKTAEKLYKGTDRIRKAIYQHTVAKEKEMKLHELNMKKIDLRERELLTKGGASSTPGDGKFMKLKNLLTLLAVSALLFGGCERIDGTKSNMSPNNTVSFTYYFALDVTLSDSATLPEMIRALDLLVRNLRRGEEVFTYPIHGASESQAELLFHYKRPEEDGFLNVEFLRAQNEAEGLFNALPDKLKKVSEYGKRTDILSFLRFVSVLPQDSARHRVIILSSDMIHDTPWFTMEKPFVAEEALQRMKRLGVVCDLSGFDVMVLGASAQGLKWDGYNEIKRFWVSYFSLCGVRKLIAYTHDYSQINQLFEKEG